MKKRKRTAVMVLAAVCCISLINLSGCSSKKQEKQSDPQEVYEMAVRKNAGLTDMDVTMGTEMRLKLGEETAEINMDAHMLMAGYNTSDLKYQIESKTNLLGQTVDSTMFYKDGFYYMKAGGQKIKYAYDLEKMAELVQNNQMEMISEDAMSELTVKKEGENTRLNFTGNPEKMTQYTGKLLEGMQSVMKGLEYTIDKASGSYLINPDGYYIESAVDMDMSMKIDGNPVSVNARITSQVNRPGEKVTIQFPDDLTSYQEILPDKVS